MFVACGTAWRYVAMGGAVGLDYAGVKVVMEMHGAPRARRLFADLQAMERAALLVLNEAGND